MRDLIDREALLKQIGIDSEGSPGWYRDTWQFMRTIDQMPSVDIPQWIPTCDRLPSESDYYLVTLVNAFEETEICIAWYAYEKDYLGECGWREITDSDFVIAWMPLPTEYKGADDEVRIETDR